MQTIVFPASALLTGINWAQAKLSEVDVVTVDNCAPTNPYGSYGGTY
jgi:hypothetical protein